jgi:hypothetical protein
MLLQFLELVAQLQRLGGDAVQPQVEERVAQVRPIRNSSDR